jgi:glucokinase
VSDEPLLLGLDFGGTKLAAGLVDVDHCRLLAAERQPTRAEDGAPAALASMLTMARALLAQAPGPVAGIGINFGGPVDAAAGVVLRSHHVAGWDGYPLAATVTDALGLPARLENDANGQALAEWRFGAGRGSRSMVYLNIGTGIGGGIVNDGRLWRGAHGLAAEFGHLTCRPGGPRCSCGRQGCLEALAAGPAMGRRAREALAALAPQLQQRSAMVRSAGSVAAVSGRDLTAAAASGDSLALAVLDAVFDDLALGLADIIVSVDPACIVLGGGAAEMALALLHRLEAKLRDTCLPGTAETVDLRPAALGGDAGIYGGAAVFVAP